MSEHFPNQEALFTPRETLEGYTPEQLIEYIVSTSEEIDLLTERRKLAVEILDATIGEGNPLEAHNG